jgi:hypothetical protein
VSPVPRLYSRFGRRLTATDVASSPSPSKARAPGSGTGEKARVPTKFSSVLPTSVSAPFAGSIVISFALSPVLAKSTLSVGRTAKAPK